MKLQGIEKLNKPKKKTHGQIAPRLKLETIDKLKKLAIANNTSMNKVLEFLINEKI